MVRGVVDASRAPTKFFSFAEREEADEQAQKRGNTLRLIGAAKIAALEK
jgi:hypothetical protein